MGGDICSLRYDLTVPFARYLVSKKIEKFRRYQIGKVYRRDQPAVTRGRLREFFQCDFDIAGKYLSMAADAETICVACQCLESFGLGDFIIKINNRKFLSAVFSLASIPDDLHSTVCSTIDKIDKVEWAEICRELIDKGLCDEQIGLIQKYTSNRGGLEVLERMKRVEVYQTPEGRLAIEELTLLLDYLKTFNIENRIEFDLSLARGTDYYTGIIFEAIFVDHKEVGAVLGGGRYDNLVDGIARGVADKRFHVPCVGFGLGITRIYSLMKGKLLSLRPSETKVFVGVSGGMFLKERMALLKELWDSGIGAETLYIKNNNFRRQTEYCSDNSIPVMVIIGEDEIKNGFVQVTTGDRKEEKIKIVRTELISYLKGQLHKGPDISL
jgi:histidyl-tRNA synthetase